MSSATRLRILWLAAPALIFHAGPALAQCAAPPTVATQSQCGGVLIGWTGPRLGTTFRIYRSAAHQTPVVIGTDQASPFLDTTAEPGVTYQYYVQQFGGICGTNSPPAGPVDGISSTPRAPTGLTAADGVSCDAVQLAWNASSFATSYDVLRSETEFFQDGSLIGSTSTTSYSDSTAANGEQYWYWVRGRSLACNGPFQSVGEPGRLKTRFLPDLVIDPDYLSGASIVPFADGHRELWFYSGLANVGIAPLRIVPAFPLADGTKEFFQLVLDCDGRTVNRSLGRFDVQTAQDAVTFPHFLRVKLRKQLANGDPGDAVAMVDLPATCVHDDAVYDSTIFGWSSIPSYPGCVVQARGLSIGWEVIRPLGAVGQRLQLNCVPDGTYWLEQTVDPDDMLLEMNESNNTSRIAVVLGQNPSPPTSPCTAPPIDARLLGPDTLYAAAGLPSDTITARVWAAEVTDPPGEQTAIGSFARIGYAPVDAFTPNLEATGTSGNPWTWLPADFYRQDGVEEVYGASLTIQDAGDYYVAYRFIDIAADPVDTDFDGSINGFSIDQLTLLRVRTTTGVGDGLSPAALAFSVASNPARRATRFLLDLPEASTAKIAIYDVRGRRVHAIETGLLGAGPQAVDWDGRDDTGTQARAGVYFARLETARGERLTTRWVLVP